MSMENIFNLYVFTKIVILPTQFHEPADPESMGLQSTCLASIISVQNVIFIISCLEFVLFLMY